MGGIAIEGVRGGQGNKGYRGNKGQKKGDFCHSSDQISSVIILYYLSSFLFGRVGSAELRPPRRRCLTASDFPSDSSRPYKPSLQQDLEQGTPCIFRTYGTKRPTARAYPCLIPMGSGSGLAMSVVAVPRSGTVPLGTQYRKRAVGTPYGYQKKTEELPLRSSTF